MRKDILDRLVAKVDFLHSEAEEIKLLKDFLESPDIILRNNDEEISFAEFLDYTYKNNKSDIAIKVIDESYLKSQEKIAYVFLKFLQAEKKNAKSSNLHLLPQEIRIEIGRYLDPKSLNAFSQASSIFYKETIGPAYWKDKLISLGLDEKVLQETINTQAIKNYKNLYKILSHIPNNYRIQISEPWELLCLCGELNALNYAVKNKFLSADKKNGCGANALHLISYSSNDKRAIQWVMNITKINLNATDENGRNALHYAALGGKADTMEYLCRSKIDRYAVDKVGANVLHFAALSGDISAIEKAEDLLLSATYNPYQRKGKNGKMPIHYAAQSNNVNAFKRVLSFPYVSIGDTDTEKTNVMHYAARLNSIKIMRYLLNLYNNSSTIARFLYGLPDPKSINKKHHNALHFAAMGNAVDAMKLCINEIKIDPLSAVHDGPNVLHIAAASNAVDAIRFCIDEIKIDPATVDTNKNTPLNYAAKYGCIDAIIALRQSGLSANVKNTQGNDALHFADLIEDPAIKEKTIQALTVPLDELTSVIKAKILR